MQGEKIDRLASAVWYGVVWLWMKRRSWSWLVMIEVWALGCRFFADVIWKEEEFTEEIESLYRRWDTLCSWLSPMPADSHYDARYATDHKINSIGEVWKNHYECTGERRGFIGRLGISGSWMSHCRQRNVKLWGRNWSYDQQTRSWIYIYRRREHSGSHWETTDNDADFGSSCLTLKAFLITESILGTKHNRTNIPYWGCHDATMNILGSNFDDLNLWRWLAIFLSDCWRFCISESGDSNQYENEIALCNLLATRRKKIEEALRVVV